MKSNPRKADMILRYRNTLAPRRMKMLRVIALALGFIAAAFAPTVAATGSVTEEEAHAIGVDAYLYFYPIVTIAVTRKQLTNQEPTPGGIGAR
jgi:hypothetical protein